MALHPLFPSSPYDPLVPEHRWSPADETLRDTAYEKLLPPLVAEIRSGVQAWRADDYEGVSPTSKALLLHWFETEHLLENADGTLSLFRYYFAQREAVESAIWLFEVARPRDKFDLMRFDASGSVSGKMFDEAWTRYVLKLATGAGKTKVISLLIAWCYFHKLYEPDSPLARNFLLVAPNIIVLDRLRADFDGLKIFFNDPILPENGHAGRDWRDDFQLTFHLQDDVRILRPTGNLFLTNIHRVFLGEYIEPSLEDDDLRDYFLNDAFGPKPAGKTTDSKTDLGEIIREIDELAVFNDEAHHIHDPRMAWFKSIEDIHHKMLQREGKLALHFDFFKHGINALTVRDEGSSRIEDYIRLRHTRPFRTEHRPFVAAKKSLFNRIVGEVHGGGLELAFASFLEAAPDCQAFAKNYLAVGFKLDYVKADGDLPTYTPDFIARDTLGTVWIIETKGREELDIPQKMARLKLWCQDATASRNEDGGNGVRYDFLYVDQDSFEKHSPKSLADLSTSFTEYKS